MKINEFISEKKWYIISGGILLIVFAVIMGVFSNSIYQKLDSMQKQNDLLSSSVNLLETSSMTMGSSIADLKQNIEANSEDQLILSSIKSDLEGVLAELTEFTAMNDNIEDLISLKETLDRLNNELKKLSSVKSSTKPVENDKATIPDEIATIPDQNVPGNPSVPSSPTPPSPTPPSPTPKNIIKAGNEIIITVHADTITDIYGYQFNLNFDKNKASYKSGLKSSIKGIDTIFKKDFPDYLLIGATMIGDKPGYSENDVNVCTLIFTANEDLDPSTFSISDVRTVDSKKNYVEKVSGWSCEAKTVDQ